MDKGHFLIISFTEPEKLVPLVENGSATVLVENGLLAISSIDLSGIRNTLHWCKDKQAYDQWVKMWKPLLFSSSPSCPDKNANEPFCLGFLFNLPTHSSPFLVDTLVKETCRLLNISNHWHKSESHFQLPNGSEQMAVQIKSNDDMEDSGWVELKMDIDEAEVDAVSKTFVPTAQFEKEFEEHHGTEMLNLYKRRKETQKGRK